MYGVASVGVIGGLACLLTPSSILFSPKLPSFVNISTISSLEVLGKKEKKTKREHASVKKVKTDVLQSPFKTELEIKIKGVLN